MHWTLAPIADFPAFRDSWQALNRAAGDCPLLRLEFVEPLLRNFTEGHERVASLRRDGRVAAMAILVRRELLAWQVLQPANAPLGLWLAEPGLPTTVALAALLRALPGLPLLVGLTQQDPERTPRPTPGGMVDSFDYITTPRITITGSFDDYWAARGKNLRQNIKRQHSRLARDGLATRLEILTEPADMARAVGDYARMESAGWKGAANSAVTGDDPQGAFYGEMMGRFAAIGEAMACRYFLGGELAASDLCLLSGGSFIILKTAYNEAFSGLSPAQLMRHEVFRRIWGRGARTIEFYGPLKDWHLRWTDETRVMYHLNHYRWPGLAGLHRSRRRPSVPVALEAGAEP